MINKIQTQRPYRHFKGSLYYVHNTVECIETGEMMVVYQALYEPYSMYTRTLEIFIEKIEKNRKDNMTHQNCRFEIYTGK